MYYYHDNFIKNSGFSFVTQANLGLRLFKFKKFKFFKSYSTDYVSKDNIYYKKNTFVGLINIYKLFFIFIKYLLLFYIWLK